MEPEKESEIYKKQIAEKCFDNIEITNCKICKKKFSQTKILEKNYVEEEEIKYYCLSCNNEIFSSTRQLCGKYICLNEKN